MRDPLHPEVHAALRKVCDSAQVLGELAIDDRSPGAVGVGIHYLLAVQSFTTKAHDIYGDDHPELVTRALDLISDIGQKVGGPPLLLEAQVRANVHHAKNNHQETP